MSLDRAARQLPAMLLDIERIVSRETPSADLAAVAAGAADVAAILEERLGVEPELVVVAGVTHVRLRFGTGPTRALLLCHQDTVWPHGTLERLPFSVVEGVLRGPGCFDMVTGLVMAVHAMLLLKEQDGQRCLDGVSLLVTGDEEVGSGTSKELILTEAAEAAAVLVLEAAADDGALKLSRKGASGYRLEVVGRAAHAGLEPQRGIHAGMELAHQMQQISTIGDPAVGTTVTPTTFAGGTTSNTVPSRAWLEVDARAASVGELERIDGAMRALTPVVEGAALSLTGGINRPPLERAASETLFGRYRDVAGALGVPVPDGADVGGGSDGNFTAGAGIPTLDGLGAVGGGAHADHEHVMVEHIAPRTAVLSGLVRALLDD